jgi:hypothetical protein
MPLDVSTEIVIDRPRHEVAAFAIDPDRLPLWFVNIRAIEWKTEPPVQVGTRLALAAQLLRRRLEYTYEVVEHVPGERFVMRAVEGPCPMETSYGWRDAGPHATAMTLRNRGTPSGLVRLITPLLAIAVRRASLRDLALLKSILEARTRREDLAAAASRR